MVRKLIKHELIRIGRIAIIPAIVMVVLAILFRISLLRVSDIDLLSSVIGLFYFYAIMATMVVCAWVGISRFYRTLFTREGYMTLSLPVSADQLIISKLLSTLIAVLCGAVVCALSAFILLIGLSNNIMIVFDNIISVISDLGVSLIRGGGGLYIFEVVLFIIVNIPLNFLLFYLVMSIGQLFTSKSRTAIAVGLYVGGAFVFSIINSLLGESVLSYTINISPHLYMWVLIIISLVLDFVSYFVTRYIIKNKVNLIT